MTILDEATDKVHEGKGVAKEKKEFYKIGQFVKSEISSGNSVSPIIVEIWKRVAQNKKLELDNIAAKINSLGEGGDVNISDKLKIKSETAILYAQKKVLEVSLAKCLVRVGELVYQKRNEIPDVPDALKDVIDKLDKLNKESDARKKLATERQRKEREQKLKLQEEQKAAQEPVTPEPQTETTFSESPKDRHVRVSILPKLFYIVAALSFIGGIVLANYFSPGDPGYGKAWKPIAYSWSIAWFMLGLVESMLFLAIGRALSHLNNIKFDTAIMRDVIKQHSGE